MTILDDTYSWEVTKVYDYSKVLGFQGYFVQGIQGSWLKEVDIWINKCKT